MIVVHAFGRFSLGYLTDRLAHAVGWSPLAKLVTISGVDGPSASLLEGAIGSVQSVQGSVMTLEPDRTVRADRSEWARLRVTARHKGWTPFSLCLCPIAVVVEAERLDGSPGLAAIGMATIVPRRSCTTRG